jgi:hypothetical protein
MEKAGAQGGGELGQRHSNLIDAICSVSAPEVIDALLRREVSSAVQVRDLSEVLFRLKTDNHDEDDLPVSAETKAELVEKLKGWARFFAELGSTRRFYPSYYATALGKIPHPDLLPSFMTALNYELHEAEIDRSERDEWQRTNKRPGRADRDRTGYFMIYRSALAKFDGEEKKETLLSLLSNATFGESAAFELIASARPNNQKRVFGMDRRSSELLNQGRHRLLS